ncbi:MAG: hypothetical protein Q8Q52_04855 [Acidimicrobiia bacterium]|nr:hypothetical protein [Acidimicrobiia bacterium]
MADERRTTKAEATETTEETNTSEEATKAASETTETENTKVTDDDDWKAKSRKNEAAAKAALRRVAAAEAKVKKFEDASKSEGEKLAEAKSNAEKDAAAAKSEAARLRVALKKGLTEVQAKRLVGETEEELEADADELLASFKPEDEGTASEEDKEPASTRSRPRERLRPGAVPEVDTEETDPAALARAVPRGF